MIFTRTGAHAPHEHPDDGRRLALIFAAADNQCGLRVCAACNAWLGLARDLAAGAVSQEICPRCAGKSEAAICQPELFAA